MVGDTLYGATKELRAQSDKVRSAGQPATLALERNFLHSGALELKHPKTGEQLRFSRDLPGELQDFLQSLHA